MEIKGFLSQPKHDVQGNIYRGRLTIPGVQWTGSGSEAFATFTITADQLADAAESNLIWTDQSVQRGINPTSTEKAEKELPLSSGYPDQKKYIFDDKNADDITEKLLRGSRLFLNPLIWNLRPGEFSAYWDKDNFSIYLYSGKIYLPDSHHRHQAILKAMRAIRENRHLSTKFNGDHQFKIELYFLDKDGEGNYFFDKNQRPKPTAKSKAFDLSTEDDLSVLSKKVIEKSSALQNGVNRVTDRLSKKSPYFMTLSTLREMMRTFAGTDEIDETELEGLTWVAADFFDILSSVRPEIGSKEIISRPQAPQSLADAAVIMHGYASLMRDYGTDIGMLGNNAAKEKWKRLLHKLSPSENYIYHDWSGDFFDKRNPIWAENGIIKKTSDPNKLQILNTGGARSAAAKILRNRISQ